MLDYKSTGYGLRNHSSWLAAMELQLLFYAMCIEEGLVESMRGSVIGAFYYILANMNREKGVRDASRVGQIFAESKRSRTHIERADLLKMFGELKRKILKVIENIEEGVLYPNPY